MPSAVSCGQHNPAKSPVRADSGPEKHFRIRNWQKTSASVKVPDSIKPAQEIESGLRPMAKNQRKLNRANHGKRPASSKARKLKRRKLCM